MTQRVFTERMGVIHVLGAKPFDPRCGVEAVDSVSAANGTELEFHGRATIVTRIRMLAATLGLIDSLARLRAEQSPTTRTVCSPGRKLASAFLALVCCCRCHFPFLQRHSALIRFPNPPEGGCRTGSNGFFRVIAGMKALDKKTGDGSAHILGYGSVPLAFRTLGPYGFVFVP